MAHFSAGLLEVHSFEPTLLHANSFLQQKFHGPRFNNMLGSPEQPQFHSPLHTGCPPSRTETLAHIAGLSGSPELLYRPHDLLNLTSVVPVKPLSCGWLCQVLPTTWNGAWPPGQELWHLLYANSGNPFLGNCFWAGTPNSIILSLGSLLSNESESPSDEAFPEWGLVLRGPFLFSCWVPDPCYRALVSSTSTDSLSFINTLLVWNLTLKSHTLSSPNVSFLISLLDFCSFSL